MNFQGIILSEKKPVPKRYTGYDSIYVTFLEWESYRHREQNSDCHRGQKREVGVA